MSVAQVLSIFIEVLILAILAEVIISWLLVLGVRSPLIITLYRASTSITEPLMRPLRRVIPSIGAIDITPMIAIIILVFLQQMVLQFL